MKIQSINRNNYQYKQKQAFKQNVLVKVAVPELKKISNLKFEEILTRALEKVVDSKFIKSDNILSPIRRTVQPQGFEVYFTDKSTPMAKNFEQLQNKELDIDTFYSRFANDPFTRKISIDVVEETPPVAQDSHFSTDSEFLEDAEDDDNIFGYSPSLN